ncbi:hypothetical protein IAU60_005355 [Kwoniella sp. DSM 27419]
MPRLENQTEEGLQGFFVQDVDLEDQDPLATRSSRARRAQEDVWADMTLALEKDLDERATFGQQVGVRNAAERLRIYRKFHEERTRLGLLSSFNWNDWTRVARNVMTNAMLSSEKTSLDEEGKTVKTYLRVGSLRQVKRSLALVLDMDAPRGSTMESRQQFFQDLEAWLVALRSRYDLNNDSLEKVALYSEEIALMIDAVLTEPTDANVAVQFAFLLVLLMHTAGRPSSFMPSSATSFYLQWSDISIRPRRIASKTTGFDIRLKLRNFKRHDLKSATSLKGKVVHLFVSTVKNVDNTIFDIGALCIAHALRQGAFGPGKTLEDLYNEKAGVVPYAKDYLERPVFLRTNARGYGLDPTGPLTYESARQQFKDILDKVGIKKGKTQILGMTSVRRGSATKLAAAFGNDDARLLLGHGPKSSALELHYDIHREDLDVASAHLSEEGRQDAATGSRSRPHLMVIPKSSNRLTLAAVLNLDPKARIFETGIQAATMSCMNSDDKWKHVPPKTRKALRTRVAAIRTRYAQHQDAKIWESAQELEYTQVLQNAKTVQDIKTGLPIRLMKQLQGACTRDLETIAVATEEDELIVDDEDLALPVDPLFADACTEHELRILRLTAKKQAWTEYVEAAETKLMDTRSLISGIVTSSIAARTQTHCLACQVDSEVSDEMKGKTYLPHALVDHLNFYHLPIERLGRFIKKSEGKLVCPCCQNTYANSAAIRYHIMVTHAHEAGKTIPLEHFRTIHEIMSASGTAKNWDAAARIDLSPLSISQRYQKMARKRDHVEDMDLLCGPLKRRVFGNLTRDGAQDLEAAALSFAESLLTSAPTPEPSGSAYQITEDQVAALRAGLVSHGLNPHIATTLLQANNTMIHTIETFTNAVDCLKTASETGQALTVELAVSNPNQIAGSKLLRLKDKTRKSLVAAIGTLTKVCIPALASRLEAIHQVQVQPHPAGATAAQVHSMTNDPDDFSPDANAGKKTTSASAAKTNTKKSTAGPSAAASSSKPPAKKRGRPPGSTKAVIEAAKKAAAAAKTSNKDKGKGKAAQGDSEVIVIDEEEEEDEDDDGEETEQEEDDDEEEEANNDE